MAFDLVQRSQYVARLILNNRDRDIIGQELLTARQASLDGFDHPNRVFTRLALHLQDDRWRTVQSRDRSTSLVASCTSPKSLKRNSRMTATADDQVGKLRA